MKKRGFTLIEILMVTALVLLIFRVGSLIDISSLNRNLLNTEQTTLVSIISKARSRSMNNVAHTEHGVHIDTDAYTIFEGTTFDPSVSTNERIPKNSKSTIITGLNDFYFAELSGEPSSTGTIQINDGTNTKTITIKTGGLIDW